jgi:hypothetical protein
LGSKNKISLGDRVWLKKMLVAWAVNLPKNQRKTKKIVKPKVKLGRKDKKIKKNCMIHMK